MFSQLCSLNKQAYFYANLATQSKMWGDCDQFQALSTTDPLMVNVMIKVKLMEQVVGCQTPDIKSLA